MNDETRKKWEAIADECFDRAYEKAESQITSKALLVIWLSAFS